MAAAALQIERSAASGRIDAVTTQKLEGLFAAVRTQLEEYENESRPSSVTEGSTNDVA
jgi:hypothetical protein